MALLGQTFSYGMLNHNSSYPKFYLFCITYFDFVHVLKDLFPQKIQCTTKLLFGGAIEVCFHTQWSLIIVTTHTASSAFFTSSFFFLNNAYFCFACV